MANKPYTLPETDLTLEQKAGQLFMPAVFINDSEEEVQKMEQLIAEDKVGSICFFHSRASAATNFEGKKKIIYNEQSLERLTGLIERYQKAAKTPLLVAMDAEWGLAMRIENTPQYPYAITLGALQNNLALIQRVGKAIGLDCKEAGIHWNLAPVVDINNNPENPVIGYRSFGDDKSDVFQKARAFVDGMASSGTLNSIKHFPGHGDTATDSHLGLPVIDKSMDELLDNELFPFQELIKHGVDSIMVGHLQLPQLDAKNPSTTSPTIIQKLLRKQLGFDGVVISDALNMHAVSKSYTEKGKLECDAFMAGMDVLCFSEHVEEGIQYILKAATPERIEESYQRIWKLKERAFASTPDLKSLTPMQQSDLNHSIAEHSLTELYGSPNTISACKQDMVLHITVNIAKPNLFAQQLESQLGLRATALDLEKTELPQNKNVVLSIFPPAVKPKDQFGFDLKLLKAIQQIIANNEVLLYLFGNPYVLDMLELQPSTNVVVVYQDFPEFQEVAFLHFMGRLSAKGQLPIALKTFTA